ncbi:MAG: TonB-dependent receptor [Sphingobacteriaceae bacterium]|nr:MAG: TonB-dependent receptor [Sphingobacteriaceae bacterium]
MTKLYKSFSWLFIFLSAISFAANAQTTGRLNGKLIDATNSKPLDFATIILLNPNNQIIKTAQTDASGSFRMDAIAFGTYSLKISYVGYNPIIRPTTFDAAHTVLSLGSIKMALSKTSVLKEVTVQAKKNTIQLGIDRKSFNVEQSLVSQGGSATDLLSNVPSVSVDIDGNVSLRGSSSVRILIDGKPSLLGGSSIADVLQSIPASSIETIELITNPSSKYDPEGQSGIINIVLKKNSRRGLNGNVSITGGLPNTFNTNVALAYQNKNVNLYGNYSHRYGQRSGSGFSNRTNFRRLSSGADTTFTFNQNSSNTRNFTGDVFKVGMDYNIGEKTTVGVSSNVNLRKRDGGDNGLTQGIGQFGNLNSSIDRNNSEYEKGNNYDFNFDFSHKFKKPQEELTSNISFGRGMEDETQNFNTNTYNYVRTPSSLNNLIQQNLTDGNFRNWNLQLDYTNPLTKTSKLELGYRTTLSRNASDFDADTLNNFGNFVNDPRISTNFVYDEKIHAVYGNYQKQLGNFGVQAGLRAEQALINTALLDSNKTFNQNYFRIYPSVFLTQKFTGEQTLQLSYTRRVNRPRDRQIIPFLDRSDALNYRTGNPSLRPEDVHSFELSYAKYWATTTLTSSAYYRQTNGAIQRITSSYDNTGIQLTRFENVARAITSGLELIGRTEITNKWNATANLNFYNTSVKGDPSLGLADNSGFAWNGNVTTNFPLPFNISGQARFDYQAPQVIAQGKTRTNYGLDAGLRYDFLAKKVASISLNARDIFKTRRFGSITSDPTFYNVTDRRFSSRQVNLTFAYRFGRTLDQMNKKKDRKEEQRDQTPDEPTGGN